MSYLQQVHSAALLLRDAPEQMHTSGALHFPCAHAGLHTGTAQVAPLHPAARASVSMCAYSLDNTTKTAEYYVPEQVHESGDVQLPLTQGLAQIAELQVAPVQPAAHVHESGFVQLPLTHAGEQTGVTQPAPLHPASHVHVFGAVQLPWALHGVSQIAASQPAPVHPASHVQVSGDVHVP